jgi:hypothetical protein
VGTLGTLHGEKEGKGKGEGSKKIREEKMREGRGKRKGEGAGANFAWAFQASPTCRRDGWKKTFSYPPSPPSMSHILSHYGCWCALLVLDVRGWVCY